MADKSSDASDLVNQFVYQPIFEHGEDDQTQYRKLDAASEHISVESFDGRTILKVGRDALRLLAAEAFDDISHLLRSSHLAQLRKILDDPEATLFMHGSRGSRTRTLMLDVSHASLDPTVLSRSPEIGPLHLEDGEPLQLCVFVDHSIVEVFANGRQCLTLRAYPNREDSAGVSVFARGGEAQLVSLTAWRMRSVGGPQPEAEE